MSATVAISPADPMARAAPTVWVTPAPRSEPPTDDERASAGLDAPPVAALLLPLDLAGAQLARLRRHAAEVVRPVTTARRAIPAPAAVGLDGAVHLDVQPSPARLATRRFLATCVEVIGGFRPMAQLRPLCFPEQFADIAERLGAHPATGPGWRSRSPAPVAARGPGSVRGAPGPPRTGRVQQTGPGDRVSVRRVQICEAVDGVAEVAVVLARRDRVWAMALRMERRRGRWLCTYLEVL
jgi:hypothetical protein